MSVENLLNRDAIIQVGTATLDRYNNTILDWNTPTQTVVKAWLSQQNVSGQSESFGQRDATITNVVATFASTVTIGPYDRVVIDGRVYEVDGQPNLEYTYHGPSHIEVRLRAVAG